MNKYQMKLVPVPNKYRFGSYDFDLKYHDGNNLSIETVGVDFLGNECKVKIQFNQFAELNMFHFNFWEENYGDSIIKTPFDNYVEDSYDFKDEKFQNYWMKNNICPDSNFYIVENSLWFNKRNIYLDLKNRNYFHYLLIGYESYIELLAKNNMQISEL